MTPTEKRRVVQDAGAYVHLLPRERLAGITVLRDGHARYSAEEREQGLQAKWYRGSNSLRLRSMDRGRRRFVN